MKNELFRFTVGAEPFQYGNPIPFQNEGLADLLPRVGCAYDDLGVAVDFHTTDNLIMVRCPDRPESTITFYEFPKRYRSYGRMFDDYEAMWDFTDPPKLQTSASKGIIENLIGCLKHGIYNHSGTKEQIQNDIQVLEGLLEEAEKLQP